MPTSKIKATTGYLSAAEGAELGGRCTRLSARITADQELLIARVFAVLLGQPIQCRAVLAISLHVVAIETRGHS